MKEITIPSSILPRGYYARHVVEAGHIPGVLSGAELKGKAKEYGSWYASMRSRVASVLRQHYGIRNDLILVGNPPRRCRVWTDKTGAPVEIFISENEEEEN